MYGPVMHVPRADEWVHEFVWHGSKDNDKTVKVPGATRFTKLRTIPDQFYYNVREVRTRDEAVIVVKIMIFFELKDIIRMLEATHDPIGDFVRVFVDVGGVANRRIAFANQINSASADVIAFTARLTYEEFLDRSKELNELTGYPQLMQRSAAMGYQVTKVVFRGIQASETLARMNNEAITARTSLRLQLETEEQAQKLADHKLQKEAERSKLRQQMEQEERHHKIDLERKQHEETMRQRRQEAAGTAEVQRVANEERLRVEAAAHLIELKKRQDLDAQSEAHLKALAGMGVNLTSYLVAQYQPPDKIIRVQGDGAASTAVHLHD